MSNKTMRYVSWILVTLIVVALFTLSNNREILTLNIRSTYAYDFIRSLLRFIDLTDASKPAWIIAFIASLFSAWKFRSNTANLAIKVISKLHKKV